MSAAHPAPHGHVACGVETEELSAPAIAEARRVVAGSGARLSLVHVSGTVAAFTGGTTSRSAPPEQLQARLVADVHRWLDPLAAGAGGQGVVVVGDDPAGAMREWALGEGVDMIVICPHRRGLSRLLGSFASEMVRAAPCPVLLVPPD
jgi:universal stress protein A